MGKQTESGKLFEALCQAARDGDTELALALIEKGAKLDAADANGTTPLHKAASRGRTDSVLAINLTSA